MKVETDICTIVCNGLLLTVDARLHLSSLLLGVNCFNFFEKQKRVVANILSFMGLHYCRKLPLPSTYCSSTWQRLVGTRCRTLFEMRMLWESLR